MKVCSKCGNYLSKNSFHKDRTKASGLKSSCKPCMLLTNSALKYDRLQLINKRYLDQRYRSIKRNHPLPDYTSQELITWALNQDNYDSIFKEWESSGYDKRLAPSFDRVNSMLPYTLDNLRLTTWEINDTNNNDDQANGINCPSAIPIASYDSKGNLVNTYPSVSNASKSLNVPYTTLRSALDRTNTYIGLYWDYI